jgi:medium-chain acyl-[acyl-carrier-protein] hydrolase
LTFLGDPANTFGIVGTKCPKRRALRGVRLAVCARIRKDSSRAGASVANQWIVTPRRNPSPDVRVLCVPDAGGDVTTFRGWGERFRTADLGIVELPGRGGRIREPLVMSVSQAAYGVAAAVTDLPAYPTVLFGHGLGALIAFETARCLRDHGWPLLALFVSGRRAPSLPDPLPPVAGLPEAAFVAELRRNGNIIPDGVLSDPELMELLLPGLRADSRMLDSYQYEAAEPLHCPIVASGGLADPLASRTDLEAWRSETRGRFSAHMFGGGHSYLYAETEAVTSLIANRMTVLLGALSRASAGSAAQHF